MHPASITDLRAGYTGRLVVRPVVNDQEVELDGGPEQTSECLPEMADTIIGGHDQGDRRITILRSLNNLGSGAIDHAEPVAVSASFRSASQV